jgi:hypothetical protein
MTSLSTLQLSLHQSQRLPGWEDSFTVLLEVSTGCIKESFACITPVPDMLTKFLVHVKIVERN